MATSEHLVALRQKCSIFPAPVAQASGRILRARTEVETLDATLRAGEVLTRYLAALAIGSFQARADDNGAESSLKTLSEFQGNLSWGAFLTVIQAIAKSGAGHPLAGGLKSGFAPVKKGKAAPADTALVALLNLRNDLGHHLAGLTRAKAEAITKSEDPLAHYLAALNATRMLLGMPLFLVESQELRRKQIWASRLLLMGDAEPVPEEVALDDSLEDPRVLYVGLSQGALRLPPFLHWDIIETRAVYGVFLLHRINEKGIAYHSVDDDECVITGENATWFGEDGGGLEREVEPVTLAGGKSLLAEWKEERDLREKKAAVDVSRPAWDRFDAGTLAHFAKLLGDGESDPVSTIRKELLNEKDTVTASEAFQLALLFGDDELVRETIGREMLDCRASRKDSEERWLERLESSANILKSLAQAVDFFSRHVTVGDKVTIDGLTATAGSADYLAMREALVNLFIHQDYEDDRTVAQVTVSEDRTEFHNAGHALVSRTLLLEGGKSTARNPLIARALRLIGFAELAGSGLSTVQREWRKARRRPPIFDSDRNANSFSLRLDWRELPENVNTAWKEQLGVKITEEQASLLALLLGGDDFSLEELVSGTGHYVADVESDLRRLQVQGLIVKQDDRYRLADHLLEMQLQKKHSGSS